MWIHTNTYFFSIFPPLHPPFQRLGHAHHQNPWDFYPLHWWKKCKGKKSGGGGVLTMKESVVGLPNVSKTCKNFVNNSVHIVLTQYKRSGVPFNLILLPFPSPPSPSEQLIQALIISFQTFGQRGLVHTTGTWSTQTRQFPSDNLAHLWLIMWLL